MEQIKPEEATQALNTINTNNSNGIVVFGTLWCAATQRVRRYLDRNKLGYDFRDIDREVGAANQVRWWTGGFASHPTLQIGGDILVEPSTQELTQLLVQKGLIAPTDGA